MRILLFVGHHHCREMLLYHQSEGQYTLLHIYLQTVSTIIRISYIYCNRLIVELTKSHNALLKEVLVLVNQNNTSWDKYLYSFSEDGWKVDECNLREEDYKKYSNSFPMID